MAVGQVSYDDDKLSLLRVALDRFPAGMLLLEGDIVVLANTAALEALDLGSSAAGQPLTIDGPDGLLAERITSAAKNKTTAAAFEYHVGDEQHARTLHIEVAALPGNRAVARIDDITSEQKNALRTDHSIRHAFHELKTPMAVLSLGLSNLSVYYDRLPDEERKTMIDELAQQVREMDTIISALYEEIRGKQSRNAANESGQGQANE